MLFGVARARSGDPPRRHAHDGGHRGAPARRAELRRGLVSGTREAESQQADAEADERLAAAVAVVAVLGGLADFPFAAARTPTVQRDAHPGESHVDPLSLTRSGPNTSSTLGVLIICLYGR